MNARTAAVRSLVGAACRFERLARRARNASRPIQVGWVTSGTLTSGLVGRFGSLGAALDMRVSRVARWMNRHRPAIWNEVYDPARRYAVVVFAKAMDTACRAEAGRIQAYGGRVVFDANVNYYEAWGDYAVEGTRPTETQQRDAEQMTRLADAVVADSSAIAEAAGRLNPRVTWIPDNVDVDAFRPGPPRRDDGVLRLVWSGMSHKADHLLLVRDVLAGLERAELLLVSEARPEALGALSAALPCRFEPYSDRRYARLLRGCDVIVSPKRLDNAYETGHTEYKITLGMAAGLPALASPQRSYVEAIGHLGGGIVADGPEEWATGLARLRATEVRREMGRRARRTVVERYATGVVAARYAELLESLV